MKILKDNFTYLGKIWKTFTTMQFPGLKYRRLTLLKRELLQTKSKIHEPEF